MERIVIEVDDATAKTWRHSSQKLKEDVTSTVNLIIKKALERKSADDFWQLVDETRKEAAANGLTEEILNELLKEDD